MQGFLVLLSFVIWIAVWVFIVIKRRRMKRVTANVVGVICGLTLSTMFLAVVMPDPTEEERVAQETARRDRAFKAELAKHESRSLPSEVIDRITSIYLSHAVFSNNPVLCKSKYFGSHAMIACSAYSDVGKTLPHVWEYSEGKFKSINGHARGLAETRFSSESDILVSPLPLPKDIDVGAIVEAFKNM